jgi:hypothetical protein
MSALKPINLQKADGSWANENGRWFAADSGLALETPSSQLLVTHIGALEAQFNAIASVNPAP